MSIQPLFAPCPRGLESALTSELAALGAVGIEALPGGVRFSGSREVCYSANLHSRIASRILEQVHHAAYRNEQDVYDAVRAIRWGDWFDVSRSIRVDVNAIHSPLKSLDFTLLRIKDAVCDRFRDDTGSRPDVNTQSPDVRLHGFFRENEFTLYLDTSGEPLFKRGFRGRAGEAPLKENLAAGIIRLSGWRPEEPFFDPMCGSGTFLLEAAQIALDIAPGIARGFGFEKLASFDATVWTQLREQALAKERAIHSSPTPLIYGSDLYGREIDYARNTLTRAKLADVVQLKQANVLEVSPPAATGVMVTNPPYGVRLSGAEDLAVFYPKLGDALKARFAGWRCYLFSAELRLPSQIRLHESKRTPLFNGALECRLFEFKMIEGNLWRKRA